MDSFSTIIKSALMKSALLIGINYSNVSSNTTIQLNGCIDDIINLQNVLTTQFEYSNITMLRDDNPAILPTRENILLQLRNITTSNSKEIWIHYSGHGSLLPDSKTKDNVLIPVDYSTSGFITDNELLDIIKNIPTETTAIFTFDCCHSGTVCDLPWSFEYHNKQDTKTNFTRTRIDDINIQNKNIFVLSGCRDDQTSVDSYSRESNQPMGAFSNALVNNLKKGEKIILLYKNICETLMREGYRQTPVFSTTCMEPNYIL